MYNFKKVKTLIIQKKFAIINFKYKFIYFIVIFILIFNYKFNFYLIKDKHFLKISNKLGKENLIKFFF